MIFPGFHAKFQKIVTSVDFQSILRKQIRNLPKFPKSVKNYLVDPNSILFNIIIQYFSFVSLIAAQNKKFIVCEAATWRGPNIESIARCPTADPTPQAIPSAMAPMKPPPPSSWRLNLSNHGNDFVSINSFWKQNGVDVLFRLKAFLSKRTQRTTSSSPKVSALPPHASGRASGHPSAGRWRRSALAPAAEKPFFNEVGALASPWTT